MSNTVQIEKTNSSIRKVCFLGSKYVVDLCGHLWAVDDRDRMSLVEHVVDVSNCNIERCEVEKIKLDYSQYRETMMKDAEEISDIVLSCLMARYANGTFDDYMVELSGLSREKFEKIWYHESRRTVICSKIVEKRKGRITLSISAAVRDIEKFTDLPKVAKAAHRAVIEVMMREHGEKFIADTEILLRAEAKKARAAKRKK